MPNGSFIPRFYFTGKPMPMSLYIAWWIFGIEIKFYGGRTFIYLQTYRKQFFDTMIVIYHGRNEYWHPDRGNFTESTWSIHIESMHWVMLAHILEEHGFPWANTKVLGIDVIQCQDAQMEGTIFGISSFAIFDD